MFTGRRPHICSAAVFNGYQFGAQHDCFGGRIDTSDLFLAGPEVTEVPTAVVNHVNLIRPATQLAFEETEGKSLWVGDLLCQI